jgi:tetratricopeptide (TPR) repeat protein
MRVEQEEWQNAASSASNLSEMELTLGEVALALRDAEKCLTYADRSGDALWQCIAQVKLGHALHQSGRRAEAESRFREAERMQREVPPHTPLYSLRGFLYCELLLAVAERAVGRVCLKSANQSETQNAPLETLPLNATCESVYRRAEEMLRIAEERNLSLLTRALDYLMLGRSALYAAILRTSELRLVTSEVSHIATAVAGFRRASTSHHIPGALLTRALLRSLTGAGTGAESAQEDLDEAWEIAERGPMRLHMADIHLYRARLFHAVKPYPWNKFEHGREGRGPKDDLDAAEELINECGYHRRDEELADAKEAAKNWD